MRSRICLGPPYTLTQDDHRWVPLAVLVPPFGQTDSTRYRNINLLAIDYAFRPRLRTRLTLGRRALPRKPWTIGGGDSHPSFLLMPAFSLPMPPRLASAAASLAWERSPTARSDEVLTHPQLRCLAEPVTLSAPEHLTSELLRTLSRWLPLANLLVVYASRHRLPLS